jgi:UDP-N-acetylmuramyl pentapeptide phosphotransferase/UDP-N-acetylglucosamine-1-phosphate transferase
MFINSEILSIYLSPWIIIVSGFLASFVVTFIGIPSVIKVARIKGLFDQPVSRSSHDEPTPRLGGTMIFAGVILSSVLFTSLSNAYELKYIIAGMLILFFIGVKDDMVSLTPIKKAIGQFFAASLIVLAGDFKIECCYDMQIPEGVAYLISVVVSIFVIMALINSINFLDGIDGLASGVGIMSSALMGVWFVAAGQVSYSVMCFSLSGSLIAFLYFNAFSNKYKIFLGDTGSMIIGFLLSVFVMRFLDINRSLDTSSSVHLNSALSMALAMVFVPVFDSLRICYIRTRAGKSIFKGDNNHIHHRMLKISGSHILASSLIIIFNLVLVIITFLLQEIGNLPLVLILLFLGVVFSVFLGLKVRNSSA